MWDGVSPDTGEAREFELFNNFFKMAIFKGAQMIQHHNTVESAHDIVRRVMANRSVVLQIQKELVDERKDILNTTAGEAISREPDGQTRRHQAELKKVREEMAQALREKEEETRREREEERKKLQEWMEAMEQGVKERERAEAEHRRQLAGLSLLLQDVTNPLTADRTDSEPQDRVAATVTMPLRLAPRRPAPYVQVPSCNLGCDEVTKYLHSAPPLWEQAGATEHNSIPAPPVRIACVFEPTLPLKMIS